VHVIFPTLRPASRDLLAVFSDIIPTPLRRAVGFIFGKGKLELYGLQSGEGCVVIDSVVWEQYSNVTDT